MKLSNSQTSHYINILLLDPSTECRNRSSHTVSEDMLSGGNATGSRSKYLLFSDEYIKEKNGNVPYSRQYRISYQFICVFYNLIL